MACRVLIAEDDVNFGQVLAFALKRQGFAVDVAEDGPQTVELATRNSYNLFLLDYHIPGLDGVQVAEKLRAVEAASTSKGQETPQKLIAMTGDPAGLRSAIGDAGYFSTILAKPLKMDDLMAAITDLQCAHHQPRVATETERSAGEALARRINVRIFPAQGETALLTQFPALLAEAEETPRAILLAPGFDMAEVVRFRARLDYHLLPVIDLTGELDESAIDCRPGPFDPTLDRKITEVVARAHGRRAALARAVRTSPDEEMRLLAYLYVRERDLQPLRDPGMADVYVFSPLVPVHRVRDVAERLAHQGLLQRRFVDRLHVCMACGSARTSVREECGHCRSANLREEAIIHHFACAYQGPPADFRQKDGSLVCPKCQQGLLHYGSDYDRPGKVHQCGDCGHSGSELLIGFTCLDCGSHFDAETMPRVDHFSYHLTDQAVAMLEGGSVTGLPAAGGFYGDLLPLEISARILELSRAKKAKPFVVGEATCRREGAIIARRGELAMAGLRDVIRERLRSFAGDGSVVVAGRERDYFLIPNKTKDAFLAEQEDLVAWCREHLTEDPGLEFRVYSGSAFAPRRLD